MAESNYRVDLPSGGWWEFKPYLTHAARDEMKRASRASSFVMMAQAKDAGVDVAAMMESAEAAGGTDDQTEISSEERNALLLRQTTGWSFDETFSAETMGERDYRDTDAAVDFAIALYKLGAGEETPAEVAAGKGRSGKRSSRRDPTKSPIASTTP